VRFSRAIHGGRAIQRKHLLPGPAGAADSIGLVGDVEHESFIVPDGALRGAEAGVAKCRNPLQYAGNTGVPRQPVMLEQRSGLIILGHNKVQFYNRYLWPIKATAKLAAGNWIERVCNRHSCHSALAMI